MSTMSRYRIAEVAERSGYSPPTLRYYERIGLLPPPERAGNGYRVYDEAVLERLSFISRAKQLGCSLDEITDLVAIWDGGSCASVQQQLRGVVDAKVSDARSRIVELATLVTDLQAARAGLGAHTPDGPCDDQCGCTATSPAPAGLTPVALTARPTPADQVPIACTLGATDMDRRLADWQELLSHVEQRAPLGDGVRLVFEPGTPAEGIARLAAAEQDCCRFFAFALTIDERGTALEVRAPSDGQEVLAALFGTAG